MKKLNGYIQAFGFFMMIQSYFLQGMLVKSAQRYRRPVMSRGFSKDAAYMYLKSKDPEKPKISKLVDISPTLPQTWYQKLFKRPADPNSEYYSLLKDYEEHNEFRKEKGLVPPPFKKTQSRIVLVGFDDIYRKPIYEVVKTDPDQYSLKE
jgi:hypothetical protein